MSDAKKGGMIVAALLGAAGIDGPTLDRMIDEAVSKATTGDGEIPFTQYRRPNGERVPVSVVRPAPILAMAGELIAAGYRFEIELVPGGMVNMECVDPNDEDGTAIAGELCANGPAVSDAVDRMVTNAHATMMKARKIDEGEAADGDEA